MPVAEKKRVAWHHSRHLTNAGDCGDATKVVVGHNFTATELRECNRRDVAAEAKTLQLREAKTMKFEVPSYHEAFPSGVFMDGME